MKYKSATKETISYLQDVEEKSSISSNFIVLTITFENSSNLTCLCLSGHPKQMLNKGGYARHYSQKPLHVNVDLNIYLKFLLTALNKFLKVKNML